MTITLEEQNMQRLWHRFKDFPGNECYRGEGGREFFREALLDSVLVVPLPYGLLRFDHYYPPYVVMVHALFDSKEVFRNLDELRTVGRRVFGWLDIEFIDAVVPLEQRALCRLLGRLGFERVQTLLNGVFNGTMYTDGGVFRLRREKLWEKAEETTRM